MATTGILGWIARIAAVVVGAALLLVTCVVSIPILLLAWPVHVVRRRMQQPLGVIGSWLATIIVTSVLVAGAFVVFLLQRTNTGTTMWHDIVVDANRANANPPPPPDWLRYFPGATARYHPAHSAGATTVGMLLGVVIVAEFFGAMVGSIVWGAWWLLVSGWTGRLAFVTE